MDCTYAVAVRLAWEWLNYYYVFLTPFHLAE